MPKRRIHIGNLKIRLPRSAAGGARDIADGLGRRILESLAESTAGKTGIKKIGDVSAGKFTTFGGSTADGLQKRIAGRVTDQVIQSFGKEGG